MGIPKPELFDSSEVCDHYLGHYDTLRGKVRMRVVHQHLRHVVEDVSTRPVRVLDVGCGDGRDILWLAALGHEVVAFDTSEEMLERARERFTQSELGGSVELHSGDVDDALKKYGSESFDLVLSHGVIMYQGDPAAFVGRLLQLVRPEGMLSLLAKNSDGMAFRAAKEASIDEAIRLLDDSGGLGHLGVTTKAQSIQELAEMAFAAGATVRSWAGVRVFTDSPDESLFEADEEKIIELEWRAAQRDPHRRTAALLHVLFFRGVDLSLLPA